MIVIMHLVNNQVIIGKLISETQDSFEIYDPCVLTKFLNDEGSLFVAVSPLTMANQNSFTFQKIHCILNYKAPKDLRKLYKSKNNSKGSDLDTRSLIQESVH